MLYWLALPRSPITPRAPDTGGVWLIFKLSDELLILNTLVSPGRTSQWIHTFSCLRHYLIINFRAFANSHSLD